MNQEVFTEAMINAETAFSNGNYSLALEWFRKALNEEPENMEALSRAGAVCVPLNRFDESLEFFKKALELDPENGDNYFNLGNAYFFKGELAKALKYYAEAEVKGCSEEAQPRLYYQMAMLCSVNKDVKSALLNLKKYEEADKTGTAALNPDVISEKIKLYMMAEDYDNAAAYAMQWISISPSQINGYMVYFSILMAKRDYARAEKAIEDAEKYAEYDDSILLKLRIEKVALLMAKSESEPNKAQEYLNSAHEILIELINTSSNSNRDELTLTLSEVCMKMGLYDEAISRAESLIPSDTANIDDIHPTETYTEYELSDEEIEAMAEEDMANIDAKIASGEISEDIGECAEIYYDDDGKPVREYPEEVLAELGTEEAVTEDSSDDTIDEEIKPKSQDFYDRLYFILLSCYATIENYTGAYKYGGLLKYSNNLYYSYFGRYTEAFSLKQLSEADVNYSKEDAEKLYSETIAFYRSKMMQNPKNNFAVIFRARMYAEIGKFAKAEEMASLLVLDEKDAVMEYIEQCRKEYENM